MGGGGGEPLPSNIKYAIRQRKILFRMRRINQYQSWNLSEVRSQTTNFSPNPFHRSKPMGHLSRAMLVSRSLRYSPFYTGHTGIGIAQLLTLGGCGIWALIDFIVIITGNFKDAQGNVIKNNWWRACPSLWSHWLRPVTSWSSRVQPRWTA